MGLVLNCACRIESLSALCCKQMTGLSLIHAVSSTVGELSHNFILHLDVVLQKEETGSLSDSKTRKQPARLLRHLQVSTLLKKS